MFRRGLTRMTIDPSARRVEDMIRTIGTHGFHLALSGPEIAELRAISTPRGRIDHVFDGADEHWSGADYLYGEDCWDTIHRLMTWHPPVEALEFDRGEPPLRHVIAGDERLVDGHTIEDVPLGVLEPGNWSAPPSISGPGLASDRTYRIGLIPASGVGAVAAAMPRVTYEEFETGYRAHCPGSWPMFGPHDARLCYDAYRRLVDFFGRHAVTGKHVLSVVEE